MTDGHPSGSVTRLLEEWRDELHRETNPQRYTLLDRCIYQLAAALAPAVVPSVDLEALAKGVRMLGLLPNEHAQAATYNEALTTAANYIRSFIGREEYLPKSAAPPVVAPVAPAVVPSVDEWTCEADRRVLQLEAAINEVLNAYGDKGWAKSAMCRKLRAALNAAPPVVAPVAAPVQEQENHADTDEQSAVDGAVAVRRDDAALDSGRISRAVTSPSLPLTGLVNVNDGGFGEAAYCHRHAAVTASPV